MLLLYFLKKRMGMQCLYLDVPFAILCKNFFHDAVLPVMRTGIKSLGVKGPAVSEQCMDKQAYFI
jgi:hypothetical protein